MRHKKLVPSIHSEVLNSFIDFPQTPFYVQREISDWQPPAGSPRRAGISSFGAGGTNIHIIVDEYTSTTQQNDMSSKQGPFLLLLSALNHGRLQAQAQQMLDFLCAEEKNHSSLSALHAWLTDVCYTTQVGRESMLARTAVFATDYQDLLTQLRNAVDRGFTNTNTNAHTPAQSAKNTASADMISEWMKTSQYENIMNAWMQGAKISKLQWDKLYAVHLPNIVSLPTYPFAKRRCWVPTQSESKSESITVTPKKITPSYEPPADIHEWLYYNSWEPKPLVNQLTALNEEDHWLIMSDKELGFLLQDQLSQKSCTYCFEGEEFEELNNHSFYINPEKLDEVSQLISRVHAEKNTQLKGIIYIASIPPVDQQIENATENSCKLLCRYGNIIYGR
jgi:acyl transferase domain-containing protein